MQRRDFAKALAVGSMGAAVLGCEQTVAAAGTVRQAPPPPLMKVGCQSRRGTSQQNLEFLSRHGVHHMNPREPRILPQGGWDLEDALAQKEAAAKYGITIGAYHLPLPSSGIVRQKYPNIMLGKSPERDREIEIIQQKISVAGRAGVPALLYNTTILPILRTGRTVDPMRGNASYSTWNYEEAVRQGLDKEIIPVAGQVGIDEMFERITYLLDRILPVAEEYRVRLANHIADPPAPAGYRGITRWNSPDVFAGIQRFAQLYDSEYHGFNLCVGSVAEGLRDPRTEILPIVRWMGERKKIFNIHLRNIKGGWNNFQEVYPDNGDMNFVQVMRTLRDVGYDGMVMPDHVPGHADPGSGDQGFAFGYGYIKALIQMLEEDARA